MICLNSTDTLEGGASVTNVVDFTVHGIVGTTFTNIAQGQLSDTDPTVLYTASVAISIVSIILVNTHTSSVTVNLYLDPANVGTPRRLIPKNLTLGAGYSMHFDGSKFSVHDTEGRITEVPTEIVSGITLSSIQNGYIDLPFNAWTEKAINEVDPDKAFLIYGGFRSSSADKLVAIPTMELKDSTTVQGFSREGNARIFFTVVECSSGIASVQRATTAVTAAEDVKDITVTEVDITKSFVSYLGEAFPTEDVRDLREMYGAYLLNSTTVRLESYSALYDSYVSWELVEFK